MLARIARALARYGRRVRWASLPAEQRVVCGVGVVFVQRRRRAVTTAVNEKTFPLHFGYRVTMLLQYDEKLRYDT